MKKKLMPILLLLASTSQAQTNSLQYDNQLSLSTSSNTFQHVVNPAYATFVNSLKSDAGNYFMTSSGEIAILINGDTVRLNLLQTFPSTVVSDSLRFSSLAMAIGNFQQSDVPNDLLAGGTLPADKDRYLMSVLQSPPATFLQGATIQAIQGNLSTEEEHQANSIVFRTGDHTWLNEEAASGENSALFKLYSASESHPGNYLGTIGIVQPNGDVFGLQTDSSTATFGWLDSASSELIIKASQIKTAGSFTDYGVITSTVGFVATNTGWPATLPPHTQGYFFSQNADGTQVVIQDNESALNQGFARVLLEQNGSVSSITALGSYNTSLSTWPGSLLIQTNGPNGMIFNTVDYITGPAGYFRFFINSDEIARFTQYGMNVPSLTSEDRLAIENPDDGLVLYDRSLHKLCYYAGDHWEAIQSTPIH